MPTPTKQQNEVNNQDVTIAASASLSGAARLPNGHVLVGIVMPAAWTAANLTFQASEDGAAYANLYDENGNEVTVTAAAARYIRLAPADWCAAPFLKVRSGAAASAVNQAAARTLTLITRPV
jgi:hypothetical protein